MGLAETLAGVEQAVLKTASARAEVPATVDGEEQPFATE